MTNPNPDISDEAVRARCGSLRLLTEGWRTAHAAADALESLLAERAALREALTKAEGEREGEELRGLRNANEDAEREFNLNAYAQLAARDATIAELRATIAELSGALEPFAAHADLYDDPPLTGGVSDIVKLGYGVGLMGQENATVTVGDFRHARAALKSSEPK